MFLAGTWEVTERIGNENLYPTAKINQSASQEMDNKCVPAFLTPCTS